MFGKVLVLFPSSIQDLLGNKKAIRSLHLHSNLPCPPPRYSSRPTGDPRHRIEVETNSLDLDWPLAEVEMAVVPSGLPEDLWFCFDLLDG